MNQNDFRIIFASHWTMMSPQH